MKTLEMNASGRMVAFATAAAERALGIETGDSQPERGKAAHADEERQHHRRHLGGLDLEVVGHARRSSA